MQLDLHLTARGLLRHWNYFSHHIIASPGAGHALPACFEEAYVVMGAALTTGLLDDARMTAMSRRFNERHVRLQSVHHPDMFDMGYGYERNAAGLVNCSCVADNASTASAMLDGVRLFPHLPENPRVLASVKRYLDHCLNNYRTDKGVMGVGVLNYQINPENMREYWCANSLFAGTLIRYAGLTGDTACYDAAVPLLEYSATYDYKNTLWHEWSRSAPQEVILYTAEGLVAALASPAMRQRLDRPLLNVIQFTPRAEPETLVPAQAPNRVNVQLPAAAAAAGDTILARTTARFAEFADWLHQNQNSDGSFQHPPDAHCRCYEPGLSFILLDAARRVPDWDWLESIAAKQLRFMAGDAGKLYYGLYANAFASGLAFLSFATAGTLLKQRDPAAWEAAVAAVLDRGEELW